MTLYYTHDDCLDHETPREHPESSTRLSALNEHVTRCGLLDEVEVRMSELVAYEDIRRVHSPSLMRMLIDSQPESGLMRIDADTSFGWGPSMWFAVA